MVLFAIGLATSASAQFYISGSGGYAIGSAGVKMGEIETDANLEATYGSYGEGLNGQLRIGYFFNDTFGVDLGLGYLHGADQTLRDITLASKGQELNIIGRGRAFGAMPSLVYKFNDNVYGRFGALIKIGGETEVKGTAKAFLPTGALPTIPVDATLDVKFDRSFKGVLPLGLTAALGYKHNINEKFSVFVEGEYMGISVKRDKATLDSFSGSLTTIAGAQDLTRDQLLATIQSSPALMSDPNIQTLAVLISDETNYVTEKSKSENSVLAETVPYSSFGINFGITYTFAKKK